MPKIAILIPAYNAEDTIGDVIQTVQMYNSSIVVVDDGSQDKTAKVATRLGCELLSHNTNCGKGAALKTGFKYLLQHDVDWIITLDADGQHNPENIQRLIDKASYVDSKNNKWGIVIGSRFSNPELIPSYRYYPNRFGQLFLSLLTRQRMEDTQSGFRIYRGLLLKQITLISDRFDLETEVILKAARIGYSILFAPIDTIYPENEFSKTNFKPFHDTYRIAIVVLRESFKNFFHFQE